MSKKRLLFSVFVLCCDWVVLVAVFNLAYLIKFHSGFFPPKPHPYIPYLHFSFVIATYGVLVLKMANVYRIKGPYNRIEQFLFIVKAMSITVCIIMVTNFLIQGSFLTGGIISFSRLVIGIHWLLSIISIFLLHEFYRTIILYFRNKGIGLIRVAIVGTGETELNYYHKVATNPRLGYKPIGFVVPDGMRGTHQSIQPSQILGSLSMLRKIIKKYSLEEVVLSNPSIPKKSVLDIKKTCENLQTTMTIIPNVYGLATVPALIHVVGDIPVFTIEEKIQFAWNRIFKRFFDVIASMLLLTILFPVLSLIALLIKLTSRGPIFYCQDRVGMAENVFKMIKFRTMIKEAHTQLSQLQQYNEVNGPIFKMRNDPRITPIGKILRKYSIDELPQLCNVLMGDMSLVGPRPCLPDEVVHFRRYHYSRFNVKPGITGYAQVNGRSDIDFEKRCQLDIYYMENWSFMMDFLILIKTIPIVIHGRGAY